MSSAGTVGARLEPPEPGLTPDEMVARAVAVRPQLVADQDATEQRTYYSQEMHEAFLNASIRFEGTRIPESWGFEGSMLDVEVGGGTPGSRLHGNPMYSGRVLRRHRPRRARRGAAHGRTLILGRLRRRPWGRVPRPVRGRDHPAGQGRSAERPHGRREAAPKPAPDPEFLHTHPPAGR